MAESGKLQLMPPVTTTTKIPFDAILGETHGQDTTGTHFQAQGASDFLEVKSCSEFMSYVAPLNLVGGKDKVRLVLDTTARPTIFTISEDDKLYFLVHAIDPTMGSELIDITPQFGNKDNVKDLKVTAFDIFDDKSTIYIAAAVKKAGDTIIYHAAFSHQDLLEPQKQGHSLQSVLNETLKWTPIKNNKGSKDVTSIVCGPPVLGAPSQAAFQITAGVVGTENREGFPFTVDPSPEATAPWVVAPLPKSSSRILEMQPTANGLLILYDQSASQGPACNFRQFDPSTGEYLNDVRIRMEDMSQNPVSLGQPRTMCGFQNIEGQTDIMIGGSQGLGFYNWHDNTAPSEIILRDKSIKQVVASELPVAKQTTEIVSKLAIFAVTDQGDLHFIEGVRNSSGVVSLKTSGLPVRRAVHLLSTQYNTKRKLCELIYVTKASNTVRHLHRDDLTSFWNDTAMVFQAAEKARTFPAYVTSLSFASQKGQPVPSGYEVELSGDPISVLIDDCSYFLDHRGLRVPVDYAGRLTLVIPAESGLDFPKVNLGLILEGKTVETIELDPAARVKKHIRSFENGANLQNARSSTGRPVFTNLSPDQAKEAANIVSDLPKMLDKVEGIEKGAIPAKTDGKEPDMLISEIPGTTTKAVRAAPPAESNAFSAVLYVVDEFIGDVCEVIENATYVVFKAVFDVIGPALELVLTIAGKAINIIVRTRRAVLKAAVQGFGTILGLDTSGMLRLLGLEDDSAEVAKTQAVLDHCMETLQTNIETFVSVNEKGLHEAVNDLRAMLQKYIPDKRPKTSDVKKENPLSWLLDNPVFAIMRRILGLGGQLTGAVVSGVSRAWQDSMAKRFKLSDLSGIGSALKEALADIMDSGILQAFETVSEVFNLLQTAVGNPKAAGDLLLTFLGNSAWRVFDLLADILFAMVALIRKILSVVIKATKEIWHIPGLTPLWEEFSGQKFTIMKFVTYCTASIMNKVFFVTHGKSPFEVLGDPTKAFTPVHPDQVDIYALIKSTLATRGNPTGPRQPADVATTSMSISREQKIYRQAAMADQVANMTSHQVEAPIHMSFMAAAPNIPVLTNTVTATKSNRKAASNNNVHNSSSDQKDDWDPDYKTDKERYDLHRDWTGLVGSLARCFACVLEFFHLRHNIQYQKQHGAEAKMPYNLGLIQWLQFACGFVQLGVRITFFSKLNILRDSKSKRLRDKYDESSGRLLLGHLVGTLLSFFGTCFTIVPNALVNEIGVVLMCGSTLLEIWILRFPGDGLQSVGEGIETVFEMMASLLGVGTCIATYKKVYKVALGTCIGDGVCTGVAFIAGAEHLKHVLGVNVSH